MAPRCSPPAVAVILLLTVNLVVSQCPSNECERPEAQAGLSLDIEKTCYANGDAIIYNCTGDVWGPTDNSCEGIDGWKYKSHPVCSDQYTSCGAATSPDHGIIDNAKDNYGLYDIVDIACETGYVLVGTPSKVCDSDGTFKPSADPICTQEIVVPTPTESESSTEPVTPSTEKITEPPASSERTPTEPTNWNGLIIGLCVGVGGGIILLVVFLVLSNRYWANTKGIAPISQEQEQEMESRDESVSVHSIDDGSILDDEYPGTANEMEAQDKKSVHSSDGASILDDQYPVTTNKEMEPQDKKSKHSSDGASNLDDQYTGTDNKGFDTTA